ncbi:hypothetical protein [Burkholderia ubonensis]|uniref:hypothetical protein n=1 Tax=Burkholderia ubonensis TaxID=101571 RepID=UPI000B2E62B9|nr:hypothetical protein [Burkholderia ubonensis]
MSESDFYRPPPREMRTPITEAAGVISAACDVFVQGLGGLIEENGGNPENHYFENIFRKIWDDEATDGDKQEKDFFDEFEKDPAEVSKFAMLHAILIAVSYSVQAMKAEKNSALAWSYASSANYWCGILKATPYGYKDDRSHAASVMAKRRHAENYALTELAKRHWRDNIDPKLSAQKAATELTKVVPLSHKKLAEIVSEAKKEIGGR